MILSILGIAAVLFRGFIVTYLGDRHQLYDQHLEWLAIALHVEPDSQLYKDAAREIAEFNSPYSNHPVYTIAHLVPAFLFMALAPLQFSQRVRTRHIRFHRWSGRLLLVSAAPLVFSAFYFGLLKPFGGLIESGAILVFGSLFVFAATRAFLAIRSGDVAHHREWMMRMFSVVIGVSTIRIVDMALTAITLARPKQLFAPSLWIGWLLTVGIVELWIRYTRHTAKESVGASIPRIG